MLNEVKHLCNTIKEILPFGQDDKLGTTILAELQRHSK